MCLSDYTVTLSASRIAPSTSSPKNWAGLEGSLEIEYYQKVGNGTDGEGLFYLCGYEGDLKPFLDQHLEVRDADGNICYCGYVEEVYRCCGEYVAWGWSNAALFNRIAVTWRENGGGALGAQLSPAVYDSDSIATHGVRELVLSLPASSLYSPLQYAQRLLKELSQPRPVLHNTYKCRCNVTYLRTQGYYNTLAWQSYHNLCGLAETGAGFAHAQALGRGCITNQIAVRTDDNVSYVGMIGDCLLAFAVGDTLIMSGWNNPQNNVTTTVSDFIKDDFESVTSTAITTNGNAIHDANGGLTEFQDNELIQVSGSGSTTFDGYYWVLGENDGPRLTVQPAPSGGDYTGIAVTITHGPTIAVPAQLVTEDAGAVVTVQAWEQYLCQRICNECDDGSASSPWTATHLQIAVRARGGAAANIRLHVKDSCSGNVLSGGVIPGSLNGIGSSFAYQTVELDTPVTLAPGQCVYVEAHPINTLSTTAYYEFGGSLAQSAAARTLTSPDGITWQATNYTTALRLLEYQSITTQLFDLVSQGNFITNVAVLDQLAFAVPTYRSGYTSLLYAIEQLLMMGDPDGNRLQLMLDCDGLATIRTEPRLEGYRGDETCTVLDCCGCPDSNLCQLTAGRWLCPPPSPPQAGVGGTDVPGVFLDSFYVNFKQCRARFIDRTFSRTLLNESLRYPGII